MRSPISYAITGTLIATTALCLGSLDRPAGAQRGGKVTCSTARSTSPDR